MKKQKIRTFTAEASRIDEQVNEFLNKHLEPNILKSIQCSNCWDSVLGKTMVTVMIHVELI